MIMEFSERQLEALFKLQSKREMSEDVKAAVRLRNNGGHTISSASIRAGVREQTLCNAMTRLKRQHAVIMEGYTNLILD